MQPQCEKREHILDEVHAASWETCVGPNTCNLTQELNQDEGSSSIQFIDYMNHCL
jgi:hypothetical protein